MSGPVVRSDGVQANKPESTARIVRYMETIRGTAVFPGVVIGKVLVLDREGLPVADQFVAPSDISNQIERFDRAVAEVSLELRESAKMVSDRLGSEVGQIFEAHERMVSDPHLREQVVAQVQENQSTGESAVRYVLGQYAEFFTKLQGTHFTRQANDIRDIERRMLDKLVGDRKCMLKAINREIIIAAHDLTPGETAGFDPKYVRGIVTETGGKTSHTAIVASAMQIPCVVGLGRFLEDVRNGSTIIVDGHAGELILDPDEEALEKYRDAARDFERFIASLGALRELPAETLDEQKIALLCNIEFPGETAHVLEQGADGIGLYRTEFLYMDRATAPDEEEHFVAYSAVMKAMGPDRPVVFRTMDAGADKLVGMVDQPVEYNPFLGLRSIRLSLRNVDVFKTQLRALLRASVLGNVRIMFPLISTLYELRRCKMILADVMEDLEEDRIAFRRDIPVGMMMEVPSAALLAEEFAQYVDFFSIGTNDLIQYTLACDRTNEHVASLYSASDPAVLRLVRRIVRAANKYDVAVNVCGEMSGDPIYTMLLLGMGLRQLSVTPHSIPEIKRVIRNVTIADCKRVANHALKLDTAGAVTNFLRNRTAKVENGVVPGYADDRS